MTRIFGLAVFCVSLLAVVSGCCGSGSCAPGPACAPACQPVRIVAPAPAAAPVQIVR